MKTLTIGNIQFGQQRSYTDSSSTAGPLFGDAFIILLNQITPTPAIGVGWMFFDISALKGLKRIVSAKMQFKKDTITPASSRVRISEAQGPMVQEALLDSGNLPAPLNIGIPDVEVHSADTLITFDVTQFVIDCIEGRRVNKGLLLSVIPPTPDANVSIKLKTPVPYNVDAPVLVIIQDETVRPPQRSK